MLIVWRKHWHYVALCTEQDKHLLALTLCRTVSAIKLLPSSVIVYYDLIPLSLLLVLTITTLIWTVSSWLSIVLVSSDALLTSVEQTFASYGMNAEFTIAIEVDVSMCIDVCCIDMYWCVLTAWRRQRHRRLSWKWSFQKVSSCFSVVWSGHRSIYIRQLQQLAIKNTTCEKVVVVSYSGFLAYVSFKFNFYLLREYWSFWLLYINLYLASLMYYSNVCPFPLIRLRYIWYVNLYFISLPSSFFLLHARLTVQRFWVWSLNHVPKY